jgi:hypothetical protein
VTESKRWGFALFYSSSLVDVRCVDAQSQSNRRACEGIVGDTIKTRKRMEDDTTQYEVVVVVKCLCFFRGRVVLGGEASSAGHGQEAGDIRVHISMPWSQSGRMQYERNKTNRTKKTHGLLHSTTGWNVTFSLFASTNKLPIQRIEEQVRCLSDR